MQRELYLSFVDFLKAFDKVQHEKLIELLQEIIVDGKGIRKSRIMYWKQVSAVRLENGLTEFLTIKRRIRQGCVMSPLLYNLYTEVIFRHLKPLQV